MSSAKLGDPDRIDCLVVIEEVLGVLGMNTLSILYRQLEKLGIKKEEILDRPIEFSNALRLLFGQGATILERQIISSLALRTGALYGPNDGLVEVLRRLNSSAAAD